MSGDIVARLKRETDVAAGLIGAPHQDRGVAWQVEAVGVMRVVPLAAAALEARDAEIARLRAEVAALRLTLGETPPAGQGVPEPIGCPCPGACMTVAEIARLRAALRRAKLQLKTADGYAADAKPAGEFLPTTWQIQNAHLHDIVDAALAGEARDG